MKKYTADFETTTKADDCRVWAYAISEIGNPEHFEYGNSLDEFMEICANPKENAVYYFHNLKFDGEFIIYWLLSNGYEFIQDIKQRHDKTFTTLITDMGQFYEIEVYFRVRDKKHINKVKFLDSLKILNFSVEQIAKDFDLPMSKLSIDYKAERKVGHQLTPEEVAYIRNDVEIMSRALQIMFDEGLTKMTIASDALTDYKTTLPNFTEYFPVLPPEIDKDIRQSYKGGFTYLNPIYRGKQTGSGIVFDANSMYPARMYYDLLPYGNPLFFKGKYEQDPTYPLYVQQFTCVFKLKKGKIPSIQIKNNRFFIANEYVENSDGLPVTLTLTNVDLELFLENYDIDGEIEWGGGWKFKAMNGLFNEYIDKWTAKKIQAKKDGNSALYRISKLCLNSLYGRFGLNGNTRKKIPTLDPTTNGVKYVMGEPETRKTVYIPIATFITSYARANIIRASEQIREYSMKKYGFDAYVYSDTDSIHALLSSEDVEELSKTMDIDDYRLGAWKLESVFSKGKYLRQKCYIEEFDGELNVTVAGLPKRLGKYVNFDNFNYGFTTEGMNMTERKLTYKRVNGGVLLVDTDFTIK